MSQLSRVSFGTLGSFVVFSTYSLSALPVFDSSGVFVVPPLFMCYVGIVVGGRDA